MNKEDAREKFGRTVEGPDGEEHWEPDPNKIRGLLLKYSREVEYLEGGKGEPYAEAYIDHFWSWCKEKMGPGYKGILQSNSVSPSGRFDRLGKGQAKKLADAYYQAHDEFRENMDGAWKEIVPDIARRGEYDTVEEMLRDMTSKQVIETFYFIHDGHDMLIPGERQAPDKRAYKYHIKNWVFEVKRIDHEDTDPSAESLAEAWVHWMGEEILASEAPIACEDKEKGITGSPIPDIEQVSGWCRELWEESNKFRGHVKNKWNKEIERDDEGPSGEVDLNTVNSDRKEKSGKSDGQQQIGSFTQ